MKLAITGKGGVGKTTLSSTLARLYADEGRTVLAADVDPDANLGLALGLTQEEVDQIIRSGYGYGLQEGRYIGYLEYEYWQLAQPLKRIIESKVSKVGAGFYGNFDEYGLYIFCKDDLDHDEVMLTMEYTSDLQRHLDIKYSKMYLSLIDKLYVCDLTQVDRLRRQTDCRCFEISKQQRKTYFLQSIR